jgi:hypothetical protein
LGHGYVEQSIAARYRRRTAAAHCIHRVEQ